MAEQEQVLLITQAEFEKRMHIKRSTRYNWQRAGILVQDKHYYKIGGKILYVWYADLPRELAKNSRKQQAGKLATKAEVQPRKHDTGPNWDY